MTEPAPVARRFPRWLLLAGGLVVALMAITVATVVFVSTRSDNTVGSDDDYIALVSRTPSIADTLPDQRAILIQFGRSVCKLYDAGYTNAMVLDSLTSDPNGLPDSEATSITAAAVVTYCPKYK